MLHNLLPWDTPAASSAHQSDAARKRGSSGDGGDECSSCSSEAAGGGGGGEAVSSPGFDAAASLRDGPAVDTVRGVAFLHLHGRDLGEAWEWVQRYQAHRQEVDILQVRTGVCVWFVGIELTG